MYSIGICDDCQEDIRKIKQCIMSADTAADELLFYEYLSGKEMLEDNVREHDLVFVDMQMPELDGIKTAISLRKKNDNVIIVFCSGYMQPTADNFKARPFRYLIKQSPEETLHNDISECLMEMRRTARIPYLDAQHNGQIVRVRVDQIIYAAIHNKKTKLRITNEEAEVLKLNRENEKDMTEIMCNKRLHEIKDEIERYGFEYAHHSYIVNFKYIIRKEKNVLKLVDDMELNCSRSKDPIFSKHFETYLIHRNITQS